VCERARALLGLELDLACCPHAAGPPRCWCRKPLPGLVLEVALRRGIALDRSIVVGRSAADRTLAARLGATHADAAAFFGESAEGRATRPSVTPPPEGR